MSASKKMRNLIASISLFLGFSLSALAQPFQTPSVLENKAPGSSIKDLSGPTSFCNLNEGYAFSRSRFNSHGSLVKTTDGGKTWNLTSLQIFSDFGSGKFESFRNGINLVNPQTNLIYANEYKSEDGGSTWKQTLTGAEQASFFDASNGMAIKGGKLLKTTNGGVDWSIANTVENFAGFRIFFRKNFSRLLLLKYSAGGQSLISKVSNSGGSGFATYFQAISGSYYELKLSSVAFFDTDRGIFIDGAFSTSRVFTIAGGGATFTAISASCPSALTIESPEIAVFPSGIGLVNGSNISCVSEPNNATYTIYKTTNFGQNWNALSYDWGYNNYTKLIFAFSENLLITQNGLKSTDGGNSWTNFGGASYETFGSKCGVGDKTFTNGAYFAIGNNSQRIIVGISGCQIGGPKMQNTLKTTDNGVSWLDFEPPSSWNFPTPAPKPHFGTEPPIKTPNGNQYMFRGLNGFRLNEAGLYFSSSFGSSWTLVSTVVKLDPWCFSTIVSDNTCLFYNPSTNELMHVEAGTGLRTAAKKIDGSTLPILTQISFSDADNGIGFNGKTLYKTVNGGKNWAEMGDLPTDLLQGGLNLIGPGKLGSAGQVFYFSRKRMSQASNLEGNNTLYKINIPLVYTPILAYSAVQVFGGPSTTELASYIGPGSLDMVGNRGILATCDGSLYETEDAWSTVRKISASDYCQGLIIRPVKSVLVGANVYHYAANFFDNASNCNLAAFRSGERVASGFYDRDEDGFRGTGVVYNNFSPPSSPTLLQIGSFQDCDDDEPTISPVAPDNTCNGVDNNCNGTVDEGAAFVSYYQDLDGDGFGNPNTEQPFCSNPGAGWVTNSQDCNDTDPTVTEPGRWYRDADTDGYGSLSEFVIACEDPSTAFAHYVRNGSDCNDSNPLEYNTVWFLDADQDGFGTASLEAGMEPANVVFSCSNPSTDDVKYARNRRDCDDTNPLMNPRQWENNLDGIDNDCDGFIDEGADPPGTTYCDLDGDGFGDPGCPIPPAGRMAQKNGQSVFIAFSEGVDNNTDCDDTNPTINPASFEIANGMDNDCNGLAADTVQVLAIIWYLDADGDGYGNDQITMISETQPQGYVALPGDCNDANSAIFPNANEICGNGVDENCNGQVDENNPIVSAGQDQDILANTGNIQLVGTPTGGSWSGTGASSSGLFNTNQAPGVYSLTYSVSTPCFASDQVVITLLPNNTGATLEKPIVSPQAGSYSGPQTVTLSSSDPLATIYYTLTGNTPLLNPWPNSFTKLYTGPIQVIKNTQIKAVAVRPGFNNSSVTVANFTILEGLVVENPLINPGTGSYNAAQMVTISTQTSGASIYYTTNGNNPLLTAPNSFTKLYEGPFLVNQSTNVKALAVKSGLQNSGISSVFLTITDPPICAAPIISPPSGTYTGAQTVSMTTSTAGATILYTTNGNIPVEGATFTKIYSQPFVLNATATIRAIAIKPGFQTSSCPRADIVIASPTQNVATPAISPVTGTYLNAQVVSITCATPGSTIYYTTNGNVPRLDVPNSFTKVYTNPFSISSTTTIRALATAPGLLNSSPAVAFITIGGGARKAFTESNVSQKSNQIFELLPNPNLGRFNILNKQVKSNDVRLVEVFSSTGKRVFSNSWEGKSNQFEVDVMGLPAGIYFVKIAGMSGHTTLRFQIQ